MLVSWTLAIIFATHFLGALGSASWLSWIASLVPRRLRGRYFGTRNSAASLTNLLSVPLLGLVVSHWSRGAIEGFGLVVLVGIICGLISLAFQFWMVDVNPQVQHALLEQEDGETTRQGDRERESSEWKIQNSKYSLSEHYTGKLDCLTVQSPIQNSALKTQNSRFHSPIQHLKLKTLNSRIKTPTSKSDTENSRSPHPTPHTPHPFLQDTNFLLFLLYFALWMFAVNLSAPFFNLYMLDNLNIDVSWVTLYNSLQAGANLLLLVLWGKLADRIGNRSILLAVGILVAVTPLFWLGTGANTLSIWLWLPLLHILAGGTWAAIDLCNNNLQLGVAPVQNQATYFAIAAAITGVSGALGTTAGGFVAESINYGSIPGVFALSGVMRLFVLLPLVFVHEQRRQSLRQMMQLLFSSGKS
jgi:MFS family permease